MLPWVTVTFLILKYTLFENFKINFVVLLANIWIKQNQHLSLNSGPINTKKLRLSISTLQKISQYREYQTVWLLN